jgi:hypothetical protein
MTSPAFQYLIFSRRCRVDLNSFQEGLTLSFEQSGSSSVQSDYRPVLMICLQPIVPMAVKKALYWHGYRQSKKRANLEFFLLIEYQ